MSATPLRRSPRLAAAAAKKAVALPDTLLKRREAIPVAPPGHRRSRRLEERRQNLSACWEGRRLAGQPPAPPAPPAYTYIAPPADSLEAAAARGAISWKVAAAAIGREAYRLYPVAWMAPDVADKEFYFRLVHLTGISMGRILLSGDSGRFRALTKTEALAWVRREHNKSHIHLMSGMIRSWMLAPSGKWRVCHWEEEHVEIAMRQHPVFMAVLEAAMGPPLKGGF